MGGASWQSLLCYRVSALHHSALHDVFLTWAKETLWLAEMTLSHEYWATSTRPLKCFARFLQRLKHFRLQYWQRLWIQRPKFHTHFIRRRINRMGRIDKVQRALSVEGPEFQFYKNKFYFNTLTSVQFIVYLRKLIYCMRAWKFQAEAP